MLSSNITENGFSLVKTPEPQLHLVSTATGRKKLGPRTALLLLRDIQLVETAAREEKTEFMWGFKAAKAGCQPRLSSKGVAV